MAHLAGLPTAWQGVGSRNQHLGFLAMPLLVLAFIVVPLAELFVIIEVGGLIGVWPTIAILLLDSLAGAMLLRSQGRAAWRRFNNAISERRPPASAVVDGVMIIVGGALLLTPGFITDAAGLALMLPPSRALLRRTLAATLIGRMTTAGRVTVWSAGRAHTAYRGRSGAPAPGAARGYDVEGTAHEVATDGAEEPADESPGPPPEPGGERRLDR